MAAASAAPESDRFAAYAPEIVAEPLQRRVECLCTWKGRVLVGLGDGTLLFYGRHPAGDAEGDSLSQACSSRQGSHEGAPSAQRATSTASGHTTPRTTDSTAAGTSASLFDATPPASPKTQQPAAWQVLRVAKGFGHKTLTHLFAAHSRNLLISVTDKGIHLHTLPELQLKFQATGTKSCAALAWDDASGVLAAGEPQPRPRRGLPSHVRCYNNLVH